jgi:hypothetical protein
LTFVASGLWAQEARTGVILKAQGHVTVPCFVNGKKRPIDIHAGFPLRAGDVITVTADSACECAVWTKGISQSKRYTLSARSSVRVETGKLITLSGKPPQILSGGYNADTWHRQGSDFLAGIDRSMESTKPGPHNPQPCGRIEALPVVLHWKFRPDNADTAEQNRQVKIDIQQVDSAVNLMTIYLPLRATELTLPQIHFASETGQKLVFQPGIWYRWTIGVESERYGMTIGFFRLTNAEDKERLEALRKTLFALPTDDLDGRLSCAEEFAWRGDFVTAATIYGDLLKQFPTDEDLQARRKNLLSYLHTPDRLE